MGRIGALLAGVPSLFLGIHRNGYVACAVRPGGRWGRRRSGRSYRRSKRPGIAVVVFILLQLANLAGEYARAIAIIRQRRNPFIILGAGISFCVRHPAALLLGLAGLLLHGGLALVYLALIGRVGASLLAVLLDQALVLAWLWVKLLRLAWAVNYVRAADKHAVSPHADP